MADNDSTNVLDILTDPNSGFSDITPGRSGTSVSSVSTAEQILNNPNSGFTRIDTPYDLNNDPVITEDVPEYEFPFMDNARKAFKNRMQEGADAWNDLREGKQDLDDFVVQIAGKPVVGTITDMAGLLFMEGATSSYYTLPSSVRGGIEDKGAEYVGKAMQWAETSPSAQIGLYALSQGAEKYSEWKEANPQDARTLESIINVGAVLNPKGFVNPKINPNNKPLFLRLSEKLYKSADLSETRNRRDIAVKLITPDKTPERVAAGGVTPGGLVTRQKVTLNDFENKIADSLSALPLTKGNFVENANIIRKGIDDEAQKLNNLLKPVTVDLNDFNRQINNAADRARNNVLITGDKQLENVVQRMSAELQKRILDLDGDLSAANVLQIRKDFDDWIKQQKGDVFSGERLDAVRLATKEFRQSINDLLNESANKQLLNQGRLDQVSSSLERQFHYFQALDRVADRGAVEASNGVGQLLQLAKQNYGINIPYSVLGIAGTGYLAKDMVQAALNSPSILGATTVGLGIAAVGAAVKKGAMSPATRRMLGDVLTLSNKMIEKTNDPIMLSFLHRDRAIVLGLLQNTEVIREEANKE